MKHMKKYLLIILLILTIDRLPGQGIEPYFSAVIVKNIDSSVKWYTTVLELDILKRLESEEDGYKIVILGKADCLVELMELRSAISRDEVLKNAPAGSRITGIMKIGFQLNNIDSIFNRLKSMQVRFRGNMVTDQVTGRRMFIVEDPDGNLVQFFEKK